MKYLISIFSILFFSTILFGNDYDFIVAADGSGNFTEVTTTHLPQIMASVGDLEFGDVDEDGDLDVVLADHDQRIAGGIAVPAVC